MLGAQSVAWGGPAVRKFVRSVKTPSVRGASPWAVLLLVASSGFAAVATALLSTGFMPA